MVIVIMEDHGKDGLMRLKRIMTIIKLVYSGQRQEGMKESVLIAKVHNRLYSLRRTKRRRRKTRTPKLHTTAECNC